MIATERMLIRPWCDADRAPYHALCRDPEVMRYLGPLQSRAETDAAIDRMIASQAANGFCFWAVERHEDGALIGFCGLKPGRGPIDGVIEIGWRLGSAHWGQGYAREAASACLDWAWSHLAVASIVAITVEANRRSWGLMERLGMTRVAGGDFDHPDVPENSPLKRHMLYRMQRPNATDQPPGSCA
jgi:RimJ/RimL family protein N-acetyltransferase